MVKVFPLLPAEEGVEVGREKEVVAEEEAGMVKVFPLLPAEEGVKV